MSPVYLFLALLVLAGCVGCGAEAPDPDEIGCCVFGGSPGDQVCEMARQECLDTHTGEWVTGPSCTACDPAKCPAYEVACELGTDDAGVTVATLGHGSSCCLPP